MPHGPAVPIVGIDLRRHGDYIVVSVEFEHGSMVEVIREWYDGSFGHHISEHGLAKAKENGKYP